MMALPIPRGRLTAERPLDQLTWLRVGGPAEWLFQPEDREDLKHFLAKLPASVPVFPLGVGSNLIVRDGGVRGVVVKLGRGFNALEIAGTRVRCGAAALDAMVARKAAAAGIDLTFLRTIPGSIGGAVAMNAGCYGTYLADAVREVTLATRDGELVQMAPDALGFGYRQSALPTGSVVVDAVLEGPEGDPHALAQKMSDQLARRDASQPTKELTAGSTFRNPAGFSSTGQTDDPQDLKAWKVIDDAGLRGHRCGGAQMSEKHSNFMLNTGGATATDLEALGEEVRKKVYQSSGISLTWEVMRVGDPRSRSRAHKP
ncbi:MAG: UDP-N-acetylmuramate dehydrogenase [Pseudomonadota bacterium]